MTKEEFFQHHKEAAIKYQQASKEFNRLDGIKRDLEKDEEAKKAEPYKDVTILAHDILHNDCDYWEREICNGVHQWAAYSHHRDFLFHVRKVCERNKITPEDLKKVLLTIKGLSKSFLPIQQLILNMREQD